MSDRLIYLKALIVISGIVALCFFFLFAIRSESTRRKREDRCKAAVAKLDTWRADGKKQFCVPTPLPKCEVIERDLLEQIVQTCRKLP